MQIGIVGLGRMGANIARRLMRAGHKVVAWDSNAEAVAALAKDGATPAAGLADLAGKLEAPRAIWIMLPAGAATDGAIDEIAPHLSAGDALIDGGNSYYIDDIRRAGELRARGIHYVDCGTNNNI